MPHFFCKLIAPRPTFAMDMTDDEKALMQQHVAYWTGMLGQGTALVFGPVMDPKGAYGMGIIEVADETEAKQRADADPVMKANVGFKFEIMPMRARTRDAAA
jgi:uncharacterized protein